MPEPLLELANLTMRFGGVTALDTVTLHVDRGEIFGLIGPNGAGKTTVFNVVTGVFEPTNGEVRFTGKNIAGLSRNEITRLGIARTFQNIRLFREMTALENVMVGADAHHRTSVPGAIIRFGRHRTEEADGHERGMQLLEFMGIARRSGEAARNLPYGDQRRLEIARAMATKPQLLLLDEPAAGFNPAEKRELMDLILQDQGRGLHRAAHRARHEPRDGDLRPDKRPRLRQTDRRRHPCRGAREPGRHRGIPRSAKCFLRSRTCTSATDASRR